MKYHAPPPFDNNRAIELLATQNVRRFNTEYHQWKTEHPGERLDLSGVMLASVDLIGVDLSGAILGGDFIGVNLSRANLTGADLTGIKNFGSQVLVNGAQYDSNTVFPDGCEHQKRNMNFELSISGSNDSGKGRPR